MMFSSLNKKGIILIGILVISFNLVFSQVDTNCVLKIKIKSFGSYYFCTRKNELFNKFEISQGQFIRCLKAENKAIQTYRKGFAFALSGKIIGITSACTIGCAFANDEKNKKPYVLYGIGGLIGGLILNNIGEKYILKSVDIYNSRKNLLSFKINPSAIYLTMDF